MKKYIIYLIGGLLIIAYLIGLNFMEIDRISTVVVTIFTIVGGIAIWIQLKRERDLKEAEFLMEYNNSFITNSEFTKVEKTLEDYNKGRCTKATVKNIDRQDLINYLVYLEALGALVNKGVLSLKTIDNLFSYRFFLATNNKIVQQMELIPDAEYYIGCYVLHKHWKNIKDVMGLLCCKKKVR